MHNEYFLKFYLYVILEWRLETIFFFPFCHYMYDSYSMSFRVFLAIISSECVIRFSIGGGLKTNNKI